MLSFKISFILNDKYISFKFLSYTFDSSVSYLNATIRKEALLCMLLLLSVMHGNLPLGDIPVSVLRWTHYGQRGAISMLQAPKIPQQPLSMGPKQNQTSPKSRLKKHLCVICQRGFQASVWNLYPPRICPHEDSLPQASKVSLSFQVDKGQKEAKGGQLQERGIKYKSSIKN